MMEDFSRKEIGTAVIIYKDQHSDLAGIMAEIVERTGALVRENLGLNPAQRCELHILEDWGSFIDQAAPQYLRLLLRLLKPLWQGRMERTFQVAGGWMLPWGKKLSVGIKPPDILGRSQSELGKRLFVPVPDLLEKFRHLTCHEYTHACTAHLRLPFWLNEGLAMRMVDYLAGYQTVLENTHALGMTESTIRQLRKATRLAAESSEALLELYSGGYWLVRELEGADPLFLRNLLSRKRTSREIISRIQSVSDSIAVFQ